MPRAYRYFLPGHVWHITHRCHQSEFLLKFGRDRQRYLYWLFQARQRYKLCVLDYVITSNHVHLLVRDSGDDAIASSMQLVAGRVGQEFNQRRGRRGAFWEDRYHATAVQSDKHLSRCLVYIDLNMVRAGVVEHPSKWPQGGYREIQEPPERYAIIDTPALAALCGYPDIAQFRQAHRHWISEALGTSARDARWTASIAVGDRRYVDGIQKELGVRAKHRDVEEVQGDHVLKESGATYGSKTDPQNGLLSPKNTLSWRNNL